MKKICIKICISIIFHSVCWETSFRLRRILKRTSFCRASERCQRLSSISWVWIFWEKSFASKMLIAFSITVFFSGEEWMKFLIKFLLGIFLICVGHDSSQDLPMLLKAFDNFSTQQITELLVRSLKKFPFTPRKAFHNLTVTIFHFRSRSSYAKRFLIRIPFPFPFWFSGFHVRLCLRIWHRWWQWI